MAEETLYLNGANAGPPEELGNDDQPIFRFLRPLGFLVGGKKYVGRSRKRARSTSANLSYYDIQVSKNKSRSNSWMWTAPLRTSDTACDVNLPENTKKFDFAALAIAAV